MAGRGDASYLRRFNSVAVLRALHRGGPYTITALAKAAGVSRPTCEEAVSDLKAQGWITEADQADGPRAPGRPARRIRFQAEAGYVAGMDIGAHKVLVLVSDLRGDPLVRHRIDVDPSLGAEERLALAWRTLGTALTRKDDAGPHRLLAAFVGTPGVVNTAGTVHISSVIPGWSGLKLGDRMRNHLVELGADPARLRSGVENDVNLAALAEHWCGVAQGVDDVVFLHAGHRMGAAALIGGKPHRGRHGAAGEIGGLSALNWTRSYEELLSHELAGDDPRRRIERIFTAAASRADGRAGVLVDSFARNMAAGIAAMVAAVDPELVVLGGGVSLAGRVLLDTVHRHLDDQCLFPQRVTASHLGDEAVALGAISMGLRSVEEELFSSDQPLLDAP
ncbi:ROK family transcriptional regulator [Streptomyces lavendulocolor]|uniref:ROK family transcriptional regulator n=1 Tax=Streptomyces lavendulocolor TaxID=67316 RepID=UPI003C30B7B2